MKIVNVTHTDPDGFCAGAIIRKAHPNDEVLTHITNYGHPIPWDKFKTADQIVISDFSYPAETMIELNEKFKVLWFDHHETAVCDDRLLNIPGLRVLDKSGAHIVWDYYFPNEPVPDVVKYIDDFDRWEFNYDETLPVNYALTTADIRPYETQMILWDGLLQGGAPLNRCVEFGTPIHEYVQTRDDCFCKDLGRVVCVAGLKMLTMNVRGVTSLVFNPLVDPEAHDVLMTFGWMPNIKKWRHSLYEIKKPITPEVFERLTGVCKVGPTKLLECEYISSNQQAITFIVRDRGITSFDELKTALKAGTVYGSFHVGRIAQMIRDRERSKSGGGHAGAAGFSVDTLLPELWETKCVHDNYVNYYIEEYEAGNKTNTVRAFVRNNNKILVQSQGFDHEMGDSRMLCVNHHSTRPELFSRYDQENHEILMTFVQTHTGWWRYIMFVMSNNLDKEALAERVNGKIQPDGSIWFYQQLPPVGFPSGAKSTTGGHVPGSLIWNAFKKSMIEFYGADHFKGEFADG